MIRQAVVKKENKTSDDFILSRIRIVRNISNYPFTDNLNAEKRNDLENRLIDYISSLKEKTSVFDSSSVNPNQIQVFIENSFENSDFFAKKNSKMIFFDKSKTALVLNSGEHLKFVNIRNDLSLKDQFKEVTKLETKIGNNFVYAASSKYGFLTQELKNCGLGMKISVLVHLPGIFLQNRYKETFEDLLKKGYLVEKWLNEKEGIFFYIISTKMNFGVTEENLIDRFSSGLKSLLSMEKEILMNYYNNNKIELDDIIFRSYGLLKYAIKMDQNEALTNISNILTGLELGMDLKIEPKNINMLVKDVLDGNIALIAEKENVDKLVARANLIKKFLISGEQYV
jgi:protein arginine kinase